MADIMVFPETWEEYEKENGFTDTEQIYTNGSRLIPSFRVEQWLDHIGRPKGKWIDSSEDGYVECPFCHSATTCEDNIDELHYCWNCGAKLGAEMEVEE